MNHHMPRTPLSTQLSRSARETEIRIRNIFSGPKKRPPVPLMILMAAVCIFCGNIVSCQMAEPEPAGISEPANVSEPDGSSQGDRSDADRDARLNELLLDYLRAEYGTPAYLDTPEQPQERDIRLDSAVLLGETDLDGTRLGLYQVLRSEYGQRMGELEWQQYSPFHLVFRMNEDGSPAEVLALAQYYTEGMSPEDAIRQAVWGLDDLEVCLYRDGYSAPIGPGNWAELFPEFEPEVTNISSWRTDPQVGREESWSIDGGGEKGGVYAERFYDARTDHCTFHYLETGRSDMVTPRGIRVGSTREEVLAAYPGLLSDEQNRGPSDYLWYSADKTVLPPRLYFFFNEDDVVYMIQMVMHYKF